MKQFNYIVLSVDFLYDLLQSEEIISCAHFPSQLIQIYSEKNENEWYLSLGKVLRQTFPAAVIVGASSVGEICDGKIKTNSTVISFSFFEESALNLFSYECKPGSEQSIGKTLLESLGSLNTSIKGLLMLSTPVSNDSGKMFNILTESGLSYPLFGGGAGGDSLNMKNTLVFDGNQCYGEGIVAVAFSGINLFVELQTYLEWHPLSREMTITEIDGMSVKTIDEKPAFSVYKKYLGIKADEHFFQNSMEFPFLIDRNGQTIARTPFFVNEKDGAIQLVADVREGEKFRIGYGNPQMILEESIEIQKKMKEFKPQAIFLFSCICRRFLLQQDVDQETLPFNKIAPTGGFYTFGEFCSNSKLSALLNSTLVAVGFREGARIEDLKKSDSWLSDNNSSDLDPYSNQHSRILSRLLYFINETTKELEEQNKALNILNEQKNRFLSIAAHDLRNPISGIRVFSTWLEEHINDESKEYATIIKDESAKMLHLLNNLLDISKIETGSFELNLREADYVAMVQQRIRMNEMLAKEKKIRLVSDFEKPSQMLSFDTEKMEQVLNNLISNAIKYSYPDSIITVKVYCEHQQVVTQVIDHGQGIPEKDIKEIFYPFKKSGAIPTGGEPSHGLGLTIVKKIVEEHHGQIGVRSEWGKGSVFYFTLPLKSRKKPL